MQVRVSKIIITQTNLPLEKKWAKLRDRNAHICIGMYIIFMYK